MRATVICESSFGNTRAIAEAIAETLDAEVLSAGDPIELEEVDLLVVGAPTHVHGLPGERSRKAAVDQGGSDGPGVRDWLDDLPHGQQPRRGVRHPLRQAGVPDRFGREGHCRNGCGDAASSWSPSRRASSCWARKAR